MRLAFFSPLHPAPSGISDYSEELLGALPKDFEITLVVDGYTPTNPAIARFRVIQDSDYNAGEFDVALYHLGNSPAHAYIYKRALREPGVIVLHDFVLHHLVAWLTLEHGDRAGYVAAMREAYGDSEAELAEREALGLEGLRRFDYPLSERVVRNARGVIVHSHYVFDQVQRAAPNVPVAQISHHAPPMQFISKTDARTKLNLPQDARLVGSFGNIGPTKRTSVLLDAFRALSQTLATRLYFVGAASKEFDLPDLVELFGVRDAVSVIGHTPLETFHTYMAAMDVCVNLRYPTAGETSGAVLRMMTLGKPVVVSDVGWFAELPDTTAIKIPVNANETARLRDALERLLGDSELRDALGANARRFILETCNLQDTANAYADLINDVLAGHAASRSYVRDREPSINLKSTESLPAQIEVMQASEPDGSGEPSGSGADWKVQVARACAGLDIRDDEQLRFIALAIIELGL